MPNKSLSKEANACHVLSFKILITSLVNPRLQHFFLVVLLVIDIVKCKKRKGGNA
jgi:hypothetical protein